MEREPRPERRRWPRVLSAYVRDNRPAAVGFGLAVFVLLFLILQSITKVVSANVPPGVENALLGGCAGFATTTLGALPALILRKISQRLEDSLLGFAAGMMLAASAFSLILPGLGAGTELLGSKGLGALVVVFGMAIGVLLMLGLDRFTPHAHETTGPCGPGADRCSRVWLFVLAVALHNLPEGMAIGVSFAQNDFSVGIPLTTAIALQDIPEGLAVALALRTAGLRIGQAVFGASLSGLLEPLGALLGVGLSSGLALTYPIGLGLAAGAMIFVVSHEVIPETHRNGHQTVATLGLMCGFALMMVLDTTLG